MSRQQPRIPASCPPGFKGRYTVSPGDTMFVLSQIFRVRLEALAANNPHITDPNILYPGDVLCVPGLISYPCSIVLEKQGRVPFGTGGAAFANFGPRGGQVISVMATLPQPSFFGRYDLYVAEAQFPNIGGFGNQLFASPENPPTWATRIELPTVVSITSDTQVFVRPSNSVTGISGPIILQGNFRICDICGAVAPQPAPGVCNVVLTGTDAGVMGYANIRLTPAQATVLGINIPEPSSFGNSFTRYRAWIIDSQSQSRFRVDMNKAFNNVWVGQGSDGSLAGFDDIIVTPEPEPGASSPTGPTILRGSLAGCR